jgi:MtfA peptidase
LSFAVPLIIITFIMVVYIKNAINESKEEVEDMEHLKNNIDIVYAHQELLMNNYRFYKLLPDLSRKRFNQRLGQFINEHHFIGRGVTVSAEMKIIIGAAAIKLSFGLDNFELTGFSKILIYPEEYLSRLTRQYHKGEANPMGILAFSWKHFKEGIESPNDNLNLGIHEFAHAYFLQQTEMAGEEPFDDDNFKTLRHHIQRYDVLNDMKKREMFRNYAFSNEMEFFAIMCEHFFETPADFKAETPQLYGLLSKLMQQDPTKLNL